eukprot:4831087-Lingulodinium_polyedra.AAC.1
MGENAGSTKQASLDQLWPIRSTSSSGILEDGRAARGEPASGANTVRGVARSRHSESLSSQGLDGRATPWKSRGPSAPARLQSV